MIVWKKIVVYKRQMHIFSASRVILTKEFLSAKIERFSNWLLHVRCTECPLLFNWTIKIKQHCFWAKLTGIHNTTVDLHFFKKIGTVVFCSKCHIKNKRNFETHPPLKIRREIEFGNSGCCKKCAKLYHLELKERNTTRGIFGHLNSLHLGHTY